MTDQQEIILDRLMGSDKIGRYWTTGPLALAVRALQEKKLTSKKDAAQALGYPGVLCHAIQGASSFLKTVDERRTLAVTVFTDVPPHPQVPRLARRRSVELALWCALRVHPLAHRDQCEFAQLVVRRVKEYLDGAAPAASALNALTSDQQRCPSQQRGVWSVWHSSVAGCAFGSLHYAAEVLRCAALTGRGMGKYLNLVGRDAARVPTVANGVAGAIDFCVALAREVGM